MSKKKPFTLIISNFNGAKYLKSTVDSWQSSHKFVESIMICDSHSTDNSISLINYISSNSKIPIKVLKSEIPKSKNSGFNLALKQVKTKYVIFCDNDILYSFGLIESLFELLESNNYCGVTCMLVNSEPSPPFKSEELTTMYGRSYSQIMPFPKNRKINWREDGSKLHGITRHIASGCFTVKTYNALKVKFTDIVPFGVDDIDFSWEMCKLTNKEFVLHSKTTCKHIGQSNRETNISAYSWSFFVFANYWIARRFYTNTYIPFLLLSVPYFTLSAFRMCLKYRNIRYIKSLLMGFYLSFKFSNNKRLNDPIPNLS